MPSDSDERPVPCERCRGTTKLATRVRPVGQLLGARVFECMTCKHQTWQDWRSDVAPPPMPPPCQPNANVQQQQQVQPKDDKDEPEEK
jgi:hypothetical protein